MSNKQTLLRCLPSVDGLLSDNQIIDLVQTYSRQIVVDAIRVVIEDSRRQILQELLTHVDESGLVQQIAQYLENQFQPTLRPVINATGVIIHTNLGRALLSKSAQSAMMAVAGRYNTLEFDLENGKRGSRLVHASQLLRDLTGADDAIVVNNNASALIMILTAFAKDQQAVVSRGQLVEIGGGFRIPSIMEQSGAHLVEVGTTNRTRIADYADAVTDKTSMFMRIHASNFRQIGFVEQPSLQELADTAHEKGVLAVDDLGSGTLLATTTFGLAHEPTIQESINAGMDLICFSGDKLLGGPQAGVIIGKQALIDRLKKHPLARALRVDKLTYAALTATLEHYRRDEALTHIPVWQMISRSLDEIMQTAQRWASQVGGTVIDGESTVGGGSLPGATMPTTLLAIDTESPELFMARLRDAESPVIARVSAGQVLFDPRTVLPEQEKSLLDVILSIHSEGK
jgi:L-seryl-tRNA(Ser) seleniumtransferase